LLYCLTFPIHWSGVRENADAVPAVARVRNAVMRRVFIGKD
jgi:hypothetical protein